MEFQEKKEKDVNEKRIRAIALSYYSREDVRKALFEFSKNREVVSSYMMEGFGKRPDVFYYPSDIFSFVKKGATSFHCSEELWQDPLSLSTEMTEEQLNSLREGWDFLIDIDSKYLDYSKILTELLIQALEFHDVKNIGVKYSGSKGFHLIVPWKSFPKEVYGVKTKDMFPEWPRLICQYLSEMVEKNLIKKITNLMYKDKKSYVKDFEAPKEVIPDLILVSSRHLFRMPYSVDYDEPICIKKDERIEIRKIGEFVDTFFKTKNPLQIKDISNLGYKTASLSLEENKTKFNKIKKVIRHKIQEDLFSVKLESGRKVRITSGHSIFVLKNGKIKTIRGDKLRKNDNVVAIKKINLPKEGKDAIILSDELIKILNLSDKKNVFLYDFKTSIFDEVYKILSIDEKKKRKVYNWKVYNILPLDIYELLISKNCSLKAYFKNAKIKFCKWGGAKKGLPNTLKLDKSLMRLLGYYLAEGHCDSRGRITFSFGAHEHGLIEDSLNIIKKLGLNPCIEKPHKTATQVVTQSTILKLIFESLFKCGKNASEKRVPLIIWNRNDELKKEFLNSYIKGDGHLEKKWSKIIISTVSGRLRDDLCFLLGFLGVGYSISKRKITKFSKEKNFFHIIIIQGKRETEKLGFKSFSKIAKEPLTNRFPIEELNLGKEILNSRWKNQYAQNKILRRNQNFIEKLKPSKEILKLINGDSTFLKVIDIKKIKSKKDYVYDVSVEEDENFVGGNCILLHNSLHEKTSLSSVVIDKSQIKNFKPSDANPLRIQIKNFYPQTKENEAQELLLQAIDWGRAKKQEQEQGKQITSQQKRKFKDVVIKNLSEELYPPCILEILKGVKKDGRKRALFILINFFKSLKLSVEELEEKIEEWNKKNYKPLKEGYIRSQLSWHKKQKPMLPPNCDKPHYKALGICLPDNFCRLIKNPVNYTIKKSFVLKKQKFKSSTKKKRKGFK